MGSPSGTFSAIDIHKPRLLHSCGASFFLIAHRAFRCTENLGGPVGLLTHSLASIISPMLHQFEYQWLLILSFIDEHILAAVEDFVTAVYPPSSTLFKGLESLTLLMESVPKKFDDTIDFLTEFLCRIPIVNMVMKRLLKGEIEEKEITVVSIDCTFVTPEILEGGKQDKEGVILNEKVRVVDEGIEAEKLESVCKEIMEVEEKKIVAGEKNETKKGVDEEDESDVILELFDEGWQTRPLRGMRRA